MKKPFVGEKENKMMQARILWNQNLLYFQNSIENGNFFKDLHKDFYNLPTHNPIDNCSGYCSMFAEEII